MNKNTLKTSLRTLIVLLTVALVAQGVAAAEETTDSGATDGMPATLVSAWPSASLPSVLASPSCHRQCCHRHDRRRR